MTTSVFFANNYGKMWCSVQNKTQLVVLCNLSPNKWCKVIFPRLERYTSEAHTPYISLFHCSSFGVAGFSFPTAYEGDFF